MKILSVILYIIMVIDIIIIASDLPRLLIGFLTADDEKANKLLVTFWGNLNIKVNPKVYDIVVFCAIGTGLIAFIVYACVFGEVPFVGLFK